MIVNEILSMYEPRTKMHNREAAQAVPDLAKFTIEGWNLFIKCYDEGRQNKLEIVIRTGLPKGNWIDLSEDEGDFHMRLDGERPKAETGQLIDAIAESREQDKIDWCQQLIDYAMTQNVIGVRESLDRRHDEDWNVWVYWTTDEPRFKEHHVFLNLTDEDIVNLIPIKGLTVSTNGKIG